jgi:hypothetical protein
VEIEIYKLRNMHSSYFKCAVVLHDIEMASKMNKSLRTLYKIRLVPKSLWYRELKFFPTTSHDLYLFYAKHELK